MTKEVQEFLYTITKSRGMEDPLVIDLFIEAEDGAPVEWLEAVAALYEAEETTEAEEAAM